MKTIELTKGYVTTVDDCDYDYLVSLGSWCADVHDDRIYARKGLKGIKGSSSRMHRLIAERAYPGTKISCVDYADGDGLNNCRSNLRICSNKDNVRNSKRKSTNKSGYKGVLWHTKAKRWQAYITADYKSIYLGLFDDKLDAARAYNNAASALFGEFAKLNEIP